MLSFATVTRAQLSMPIAILNIGGVHLGTDQQTAGIGHNMALAAFDLLGRIVASRPAALVVLTD